MPTADDAKLKKLLKAAVVEVLEERRDLVSDAVADAVEDIAMVRAIQRDPDFEAKMREVLMVYQEVALQNQNGELTPAVVTVSVDEKPGLQAIANTAPDLPPVPGQT